MAEARFRLANTHPDYGPICPGCAGPKAVQARRCRSCWFESRRDEAYWRARTCACGGKKTPYRVRCRSCANARLRSGHAGFKAQSQPQDHPWRKRVIA